MKNFEFATPLVPTISLAILTVSGRWRERRHAGIFHCSRGRWYVLFAGYRCRGSGSARRSWFCGGFLRRRTSLKQKIRRLKWITMYNEGITHDIRGSHRCRRHESVEILDGPPSHFGRNWPAPCNLTIFYKHYGNVVEKKIRCVWPRPAVLGCSQSHQYVIIPRYVYMATVCCASGGDGDTWLAAAA